MKADMAKQAAVTQDVKRYIWLHNIEPLISAELVDELMAERRVIYNQVTELTNRIKQQQRNS